MQARWLSMVAMSWLFVACGDDPKDPENPGETPNPAAPRLDSFKKGSLANGEEAKYWATKASAPNIYTLVNTLSLISSGPTTGGEEDPNCPVTSEEGLTSRVTGGCTDKNGVEWVGSMQTKISTAGITYVYSGFGYSQTVTCDGKSAKSKLVYDGNLKMSGTETTQGFEIQLVMDTTEVDKQTCAETTTVAAVDYKGSSSGASSEDESEPSTWNGSGRIGYGDTGVISAVTQNEVIHSETCGSEALSGKTTLTTDGHKVEIQYDGATDCDATATVNWSLDGAAQGELEGISCSASNGPTLAMWSLGLVGLLGLMRRRARI
ncbi:hypothetical protein POL68_33355 [Stigmatella sp. ncwal1]|uniref:MYXO-CTERM domain-containing protein n=1 Tax=Stigmatella ashevillensis TaxID=2995309 RepID=A0ABT5DIB7_9BACT|nr:hypothetical protein [Stigmatella ashevillena]MDC0713399.1 hypothetical protein [Stigmatella ashevillena]